MSSWAGKHLHKPRSARITVTIGRLSQIRRSVPGSVNSARKNEGRAILYSSNPALTGLGRKSPITFAGYTRAR